MSQRMIAIVKKIQAHIEAGPPHEELTAATILCSELLAEQKQKAPITSLKVIHVLCILCGAKSEQKCDTAQGDKDDDQHMIRQLDARRCTDLLEGRLLVDGTRVGL